MGICKRTMAEEGLRSRASGLLALALGIALALGFVLGTAPRTALASTDTYTSLIPTDDDDAATLDKKTIRIFDHTWYVIKDESTAADAGILTLLSLDNVGYSDFHQSRNAYSQSVVRRKLDAMTERGGRFEAMEFLIRPVTLTTKKFESEEVFETIENAKLFLLSTDEAQALPESVRVANDGGRWWLRSPGNADTWAAFVYENGLVNDWGADVEFGFGIRPACRVHLPSVVFDPETRTFSPRSGRRLAGDDRYGTMSAILDEGFSASEWAVLASGASYPDALSASGLAGAYGAPVVTTAPDALSPEAKAQLERLGVKNVVIMGGEAAVSGAVEAELADMGIVAERVAGDDRMATSIAALKRLRSADRSSNTVVIATGYCFVDALTVGPWCWATKSPLLLLDEDGFLPAEAVQAIRADGGFTNLVMLGGAGVASDGVADQLDGALGCTRLGGDNRYETSRKIAEWAAANGLGYGNATVATGRDFPDALAGVALAGKNASVLVVADDPADTTVDLLKSHKSEIDEAYVLGGANAVSDAVLDAIG